MASRRTRRRTTSDADAVVGLIIAVFWLAAFLVYALFLPVVYFWRRRVRKRASKAAFAASEAERHHWLETTFDAGRFTVTVSGFAGESERLRVSRFLLAVPGYRDLPEIEVDELVEQIVHVGPQSVVEGVAQRDAVRLKVALEERGARVKISEGTAGRSNGGREHIPDRVRREVWQRDSGRCVECGSNERLEYDHIIPVSRGGANTIRNLRLLCETCNRRKSDKI